MQILYERYGEITAFVEVRRGMMVRDGNELALRIDELTSDKRRLEEMGRRACSFVMLNQSAVEKNLDIIQPLIEKGENLNHIS